MDLMLLHFSVPFDHISLGLNLNVDRCYLMFGKSWFGSCFKSILVCSVVLSPLTNDEMEFDYFFGALGHGDHNMSISREVETMWRLCTMGVACGWARCRGFLCFQELSVCGILGWMFVGLNYEDVSLALVMLYMIDRWICWLYWWDAYERPSVLVLKWPIVLNLLVQLHSHRRDGVGGKRTVIAPAKVGSGQKRMSEIPPGATFELNVELLQVLPEHLSWSEWSVAQFRLPKCSQYIVAFDH